MQQLKGFGGRKLKRVGLRDDHDRGDLRDDLCAAGLPEGAAQLELLCVFVQTGTIKQAKLVSAKGGVPCASAGPPTSDP